MDLGIFSLRLVLHTASTNWQSASGRPGFRRLKNCPWKFKFKIARQLLRVSVQFCPAVRRAPAHFLIVLTHDQVSENSQCPRDSVMCSRSLTTRRGRPGGPGGKPKACTAFVPLQKFENGVWHLEKRHPGQVRISRDIPV